MTTEERHRHHFEAVHPQIDRLARLICEASGIDDRVLAESRFQDLHAFYEEQVRLGYWHPALTEALADFTGSRDVAAALSYYRLALDQARELDSNSHTILIAMAQALFEAGQKEQAEACLRDGRAEALRREDDEYVQKADEILRETSA